MRIDESHAVVKFAEDESAIHGSKLTSGAWRRHLKGEELRFMNRPDVATLRDCKEGIIAERLFCNTAPARVVLQELF